MERCKVVIIGHQYPEILSQAVVKLESPVTGLISAHEYQRVQYGIRVGEEECGRNWGKAQVECYWQAADMCSKAMHMPCGVSRQAVLRHRNPPLSSPLSHCFPGYPKTNGTACTCVHIHTYRCMCIYALQWRHPPVMALLFTCLTQSQANLMSSNCSGVGFFSDTHVNSICAHASRRYTHVSSICARASRCCAEQGPPTDPPRHLAA